MKSISLAPYASMDIRADADLSGKLAALFGARPIDIAVETGTHLGTGSTRIIADAFVASGCLPRTFWTIEANHGFWTQAKANLAGYKFVRPLWGCSVRASEARTFMLNDEALLHPERFPDVYIDDYSNPLTGYAAEATSGGEEDLLRKKLTSCKPDDYPFVALDSAGGLGWLEFKIVEETLRDRDYLLFLDDIEHIKHFRSFAFVRQADRTDWEVLLQKDGWAICRHRAV